MKQAALLRVAAALTRIATKLRRRALGEPHANLGWLDDRSV
jgi:hypothetical protein